jgi:hypothetical protein
MYLDKLNEKSVCWADLSAEKYALGLDFVNLTVLGDGSKVNKNFGGKKT